MTIIIWILQAIAIWFISYTIIDRICRCIEKCSAIKHSAIGLNTIFEGHAKDQNS